MVEFPSRFPVILVSPEHPHNIGFCARAMRAYGNGELRVVWENRDRIPRASWVTAHASAEILERAAIYSRLEDALADCQAAVAFSRRIFDLVVDYVELPALGNSPWMERERVALVFGRESSGLSAAEVSLCTCQCEIPAPGNMSLNLAQAVAVAHYELARCGFLQGQERRRNLERPSSAGLGEIDSLVRFLMRELSGRMARYPWNEVAIRKWLARLAPDAHELRALFGMFRALTASSARSEKKREEQDKSRKSMDI